MKYSLSQHIEMRTTYIGLAIYIGLVFIFPFILVTAVSFGESSLMHDFIAPFMQYKFVLIIASGLFVGFISNHSPFINSILVGFLGVIVWLFIIGLSTLLTDTSLSFNIIATQSIINISLCAAGGFFVTLYKYAITGSNKSFVRDSRR